MTRYIFECFVVEKDMYIKKYCSTEKEVLQNYFLLIGDIRSCIKIFTEYKKAQSLDDSIQFMKYMFGFKYSDSYNYLVIKREEIVIGSSFFIDRVVIEDSDYIIFVDRDLTPSLTFHTNFTEDEQALLLQRLDTYLSSIRGAPATETMMREVAETIRSIIKECVRR